MRVANRSRSRSRVETWLTQIGPSRGRGGIGTQLLGAIKMSRNSEIIIHKKGVPEEREKTETEGERSEGMSKGAAFKVQDTGWCGYWSAIFDLPFDLFCEYNFFKYVCGSVALAVAVDAAVDVIVAVAVAVSKSVSFAVSCWAAQNFF